MVRAASETPLFAQLRGACSDLADMAVGSEDGDLPGEWQTIHEQLRELAADDDGAEEGGDDDADDWQDVSGGALLGVFECCEGGHEEDLKGLLEQHPEIELNQPGPGGDTALNLACLYGHLSCVKLLLEYGAEANILNEEDGSSVLHDAAAGGYFEICQLLLVSSPELVKIGELHGPHGPHGQPRMHGLLEQSPCRLVVCFACMRRCLISLPAADEDGDTPLHNAARGNHASVVSLMLSAGADPMAVNKEGNTPAREAEDEDVIAILEKAMPPSADSV